MDLDIPGIAADIAHELAQNGTSIVLAWDEWPSDSVVNPVDNSRSGTSTPRTETVPAFVHYVQAAGQASVRQFAEVEVGDVILDFAADVDLSGRDNLRFGIGGRWYVPKPVGDKLAASWDVLVQDQKLFRTVLVRVAT